MPRLREAQPEWTWPYFVKHPFQGAVLSAAVIASAIWVLDSLDLSWFHVGVGDFADWAICFAAVAIMLVTFQAIDSFNEKLPKG